MILQIIIIKLQKKLNVKESNLLGQLLYKISIESSDEKHVYDYLKEIGKVLNYDKLSFNCFSNLIGGIFRLFKRFHGSEKMMDYFHELIQSIEEKKQNWKLYLLAKECMIYGYFSISKRIFEKLEDKFKDEMSLFWIQCLLKLSSAETELIGMTPNVSNSISLLISSQISFQSTTFLIKTTFQRKYLKLRENYLKSIQKVKNIIVFLKGDDLNKISYKLLSDTREDFKKLHDKYNSVKRKFFDIDIESFEILNSYQLSCMLIYHIISLIMNEKFEKYSLLEEKCSILKPFYKSSTQFYNQLQNQVRRIY